jgi:hypothetical protein
VLQIAIAQWTLWNTVSMFKLGFLCGWWIMGNTNAAARYVGHDRIAENIEVAPRTMRSMRSLIAKLPRFTRLGTPS